MARGCSKRILINCLTRRLQSTIVPILTTLGHFQMVETEDAPGHVDILTMERQYVGSCDIRGMVDAFGIQRSHAILMQIWIEHNKRQGSNCNVMLISTSRIPCRR